MKLYLVQHGKAESKEADPKRPLTETGHRELKKMLSFLKTLNLKVDSIFHSGKMRAEQTAQILSQAVNSKNNVSKRDDLGPNDDVKIINSELQKQQRDVMLVRHLVLPNKLAGSFEIIDFLDAQISSNTAINIMDQYRPCFKASKHPRINRRPTRREYESVRRYAARIGLSLII